MQAFAVKKGKKEQFCKQSCFTGFRNVNIFDFGELKRVNNVSFGVFSLQIAYRCLPIAYHF
jgi:hypothetical protein